MPMCPSDSDATKQESRGQFSDLRSWLRAELQAISTVRTGMRTGVGSAHLPRTVRKLCARARTHAGAERKRLPAMREPRRHPNEGRAA